MFNPISLNAAFGMAKTQEEYLMSTKKNSKPVGEKSSGTPYSTPGFQEGRRAPVDDKNHQLLQ